MIRILLLIIFVFLIDWYSYQAFKTVFPEQNWIKIGFWIFSFFVYLFVTYGFLTFSRGNLGLNFGRMISLLVLSLIPKLIVLGFMFGEDILRFLTGIFYSVAGNQEGDFLPDRRKFVSQAALALSAVPFLGILHGVLVGKYRYRVVNHTLEFDDLPQEFDGFTITQISDIHSGSFDNKKKLEYGIDLINQQKSDVILFTGDLVNNHAKEMEPWIDTFKKLKAPMGKYSILGNHDYGDYISWPSKEAKEANLQRLYEIQEELGFTLLRNEHVKIIKSGASIDLIGVENWGKGFGQYGDLKKAAVNLSDQSFKILMSHDPSHFDEEVKKFSQLIHLTLSGHTHGMQFGIEIPGFIKWSPASLRYPKWAGLYEELGRYLHVNRGFGFLAFPGRVGIWPEITVLTLKKK
ncbi:putative MPP superfamily phosphohydrolase [Algoriphagus sp. 4150]|uniref:metallophosphoesterase n=1 Tax=Algoriphagus sp. 4150 TaxID=2817756 RepID=UPI00285EFCBB|nr:metallophosphoesterase [Algoriphagus sp. 4150]MDR7129056.1 putative MPP superfamily phosphohydrolase [Algoriphagus sp. 4150]